MNLGLPARNIALGELVNAVRDAEARLRRLEASIEELVAGWELRDLVMGFVGLVPSERSTGDRARRGSITKTGNSTVRKTLVESAWCYRHAPRVGVKKLPILQQLPKPIVDLSWKAQVRLCGRYRKLTAAGKRNTIATTAIARELTGFVWAIGRDVRASG